MSFKLGAINEEVEGLAEAYQRIKVLLLTEKGSLPGDPRYGVRIADLLPYTAENKPKVIAEILDAIGLYEPAIRVSKIDVRENTVTVTAESVGAIII